MAAGKDFARFLDQFFGAQQRGQMFRDAVKCRGAFVPRAPSGVSAEPQSRTVVLLSWRYEPGHEYTIVEISRRAENEQYRVVGFMSGRINTLLNTGLRPDTRYFFRLRACQGRRCSEYSREAIGEPR